MAAPATSKIPWKYVGIGVAVFLLLALWTGYNGLVMQHEAVKTAWAQVETQYQRRFDLVPNLVNTVKGAARFEQETLQNVTEARTKWMAAGSTGERIGIAQGFDSALSRLLVTMESYPQLQATAAYRDLMAQLEGTENRVAVARKDYNEAVQSYNVTVKRFPGNILAAMFGFSAEAFFENAPGAESVPSVNFDA